MKRSEEEYVANNVDGDKEVAYNVNNNLMSVRDLQEGFDTSLLTPEKRAEYENRETETKSEKKKVTKKDGE